MPREHERILPYCAQDQDLNSTKPKPRHISHVVVIARFVTCSFCLSGVPLFLCYVLCLHSCLKLLAAHPTSASSERRTKISKAVQSIYWLTGDVWDVKILEFSYIQGNKACGQAVGSPAHQYTQRIVAKQSHTHWAGKGHWNSGLCY